MRALLSLLLALAGLAEAQAMGPGTMHDGWRWWMPFPGLLSLILAAVAIAGLILLLRPRDGWRSWTRRSAMDILNERYARGDWEEYPRRKEDLSGRHGEPPRR